MQTLTILISTLVLLSSVNLPGSEVQTSGKVCKEYSTYYAFNNIVNEEKYVCYGKPSQRVQVKKCTLCFKLYYLQDFCKDGNYTATFCHSETKCKRSNSSYHDNRKISLVEPCGCDDDLLMETF